MFKLIKQRLQSTYSLVGNNSPIVDLIPLQQDTFNSTPKQELKPT